MTTLPALSTPCTWNTFLARSTPMVLTCMWTTPSSDSLFNDHPLAHSMPGAGVVHPIIRDAVAQGLRDLGSSSLRSMRLLTDSAFREGWSLLSESAAG